MPWLSEAALTVSSSKTMITTWFSSVATCEPVSQGLNPCRSTNSVLIGASMRVGTDGIGTDTHRDYRVGSCSGLRLLGGLRLGYTITANHERPMRFWRQSITTFASSSDIVAVGRTQAVGTASAVTEGRPPGIRPTVRRWIRQLRGFGFSHELHGRMDHAIAIGQGATVTGPVAMALGRGSTAGANEWVVGATAYSTDEFIIRGNNGGAMRPCAPSTTPTANVSASTSRTTTAPPPRAKMSWPVSFPSGGSLILYVKSVARRENAGSEIEVRCRNPPPKRIVYMAIKCTFRQLATLRESDRPDGKPRTWSHDQAQQSGRISVPSIVDGVRIARFIKAIIAEAVESRKDPLGSSQEVWRAGWRRQDALPHPQKNRPNTKTKCKSSTTPKPKWL